MLQIIRFLKGYLSIKVWGFSTERFINLCGNYNIFLWDIVNHGDYYTMCISLKGFYQLKNITRKTGTRVVITSRYGLPFLSLKLKKRKIFLAGFLGSMFFWIWMSGFIWNVEIQGNLYVTDDVFQDFLTENGVEAGMKKKIVDIETLEKSIRNEFDIVTWTSARIDGTKLVIQVKENDLVQNFAEDTKENMDEAGYDIIADKDGVVEAIITRSGVPKVREGDEVKKGDVLVEGSIPIYNEDQTIKRYEYCKADADILLKYSFTVTEEIVEKYEKRIYTGRQVKRQYIFIAGKKLMLPVVGNNYEFSDKLESQYQAVLFGGYDLPVYFGKTVIKEYTKEEGIYTKEEIKNKFEEKILKLIESLDEKGVQIIEKNVTIKKYKGKWQMQVDFTVTEPAGKESKIEIAPLEDEQGV
ncbi:MAG: sporulation protein YqfD [Lachnospiraceae bacterium]|nr:sporulation protein YqfD [Lachnospiraceae bacterium]MBD5455971.1 sporulation protein YqfD [Lachnospiraceae bacterium]